MKTYIFDYNGTIVDDVGIAVKCENQMLEERGLPHGYTIQQYQDMFMVPMEEYYRKMGYTFENEDFADVAQEFTALYAEKFAEAGLCEGVMELLDRIHNSEDECVILSSCHEPLLKQQCDQLGISSFFKKIMGIDNCLGGSKTDIAKAWLKEEGISSEDCIYFGDTLADYETANAIGVENIILVSSGHQSYERLKKVCPATIHSLKEFLL